jgi:predicted GIY-YIG superfamily endonuclease
MKQPCVYIVASKRNGTLYTGITTNLQRRIFEHREGLVAGFSKKYGCKILVWYEAHETITGAITREKQIKAGNRAKKLALIESLNPEWMDLQDEIMPKGRHCEELLRRSNPALAFEFWIASLRSQ